MRSRISTGRFGDSDMTTDRRSGHSMIGDRLLWSVPPPPSIMCATFEPVNSIQLSFLRADACSLFISSMFRVVRLFEESYRLGHKCSFESYIMHDDRRRLLPASR